jgi:hypothetical protein
MMEKQNRTVEKDAAGDAGVLDDIVDAAVGKMDAKRVVGHKAGYGIPPSESGNNSEA